MAAIDIAFAEEARSACSRALLKIATGQNDRAVEILEVFGQKCARIVADAEMSADQGNLREGTFDLTDLKVDLHNDQPEREG